METTRDKLEKAIRNVPDFPKKGINFKDITPVLADPNLCEQVIRTILWNYEDQPIDAIACIDARGFIFGSMLSQKLHVPLIPVRKAGKLPYDTFTEKYSLEYGEAEIEIHTDALEDGWNVLIHDDLLATGGTAEAAAKLIEKRANIVGFSFVIELSFLNGRERLAGFSKDIQSLVTY